jgi:undecaprenyl-diphosphatase
MASEHSLTGGPVRFLTVRARIPAPAVLRRRADGLALVGGLAVATAAAVAASGPVQSWESGLFRAFNGMPPDYSWALWPIQQLGMALAIPVGALFLGRLARSWRPPLVLIATATLLGWGAANVVRDVVGRSRPAALLTDVRLGYDVPSVGMAFPSGHTIVVLTLATVLAPYLSSRVDRYMLALALLVALARMYAGAHLPLDLAGGAACGVVVGSTVNLVAGIFGQPAEMEPGPDG